MKKMLMCCLAVFICSCSGVFEPKYSVEREHDAVEKRLIIQLVDNKLDHMSGWPFLYVNSTKIFFEDKKKSAVYINIQYDAPDWLFIEPGQSLVLVIDGTRFRISGPGSINDRKITRDGLVGVRERASYEVPPSFFGKMASAKSITVRLVGKTSYITKDFGEANLRLFQQFYDEHVKTIPEDGVLSSQDVLSKNVVKD